MNKYERILGGLFGVACGDALGGTLEFMSKGEIERKASYYAHRATGGMSAGNGSLMRRLPVALYYNDVDKMLEITASQSMLTHYDGKAAEACKFYNMLAYRYLNDKPKIPTIEECIEKYPDYKQVFRLTKKELKPSGYVLDTLICALWCFINTSSFEDAVCEAANLGGDADTTAAITGGMAGVYYGYDAIPDGWKEKILLKDHLTSIAKRMHGEV